MNPVTLHQNYNLIRTYDFKSGLCIRIYIRKGLDVNTNTQYDIIVEFSGKKKTIYLTVGSIIHYNGLDISFLVEGIYSDGIRFINSDTSTYTSIRFTGIKADHILLDALHNTGWVYVT